MANVKITALPAATVPLAGTEVLEIVQSGISSKVAASAIGNSSNSVRTVATGGTGAATLTGYVKGTGTTPMTAAATIPVADISGTLPVASGGTGRAVGNYSVYSREIHVSVGDGNDTTGDGTLINPVATIAKALTLQTVTRLTIILHPGTYAENPTINTNFTTIFATGLNGGNTQINGTLTVNATTRVSGPIIDNLVIASTANCYVTSCSIRASVVKSGSGYVEILNCEMSDTFTGITVSGTGIVSIVGGKCWFPTVSNAFASVLIKDCYQVVTPVLTAGTLSFDGCVIAAAAPASNAIITSAGTNISLANTFILNSATTGVERISLGGSYSILNLVYDKPNSTFTGSSLNAIDYFQRVNVDNIMFTNLTVATLPSASTSLAGTRAFVTDALTPTFGSTVAAGGAVKTPVYSDGTNWKVG
jgi:hypothetical protein